MQILGFGTFGLVKSDRVRVYRVTASGLDTGSRQYISSGHRGSDQAMSEP